MRIDPRVGDEVAWKDRRYTVREVSAAGVVIESGNGVRELVERGELIFHGHKPSAFGELHVGDPVEVFDGRRVTCGVLRAVGADGGCEVEGVAERVHVSRVRPAVEVEAHGEAAGAPFFVVGPATITAKGRAALEAAGAKPGVAVEVAPSEGACAAALRAILFQVVQGKVLERDACITQARAALNGHAAREASCAALLRHVADKLNAGPWSRNHSECLVAFSAAETDAMVAACDAAPSRWVGFDDTAVRALMVALMIARMSYAAGPKADSQAAVQLNGLYLDAFAEMARRGVS